MAMSVLRWILLAMSVLRWILQMSCFLLRSSPVLLRRNHISPVQLLRLPARQHTPVLLSSLLHITDCTIPVPFPLYHLLHFDFFFACIYARINSFSLTKRSSASSRDRSNSCPFSESQDASACRFTFHCAASACFSFHICKAVSASLCAFLQASSATAASSFACSNSRFACSFASKHCRTDSLVFAAESAASFAVWSACCFCWSVVSFAAASFSALVSTSVACVNFAFALSNAVCFSSSCCFASNVCWPLSLFFWLPHHSLRLRLFSCQNNFAAILVLR